MINWAKNEFLRINKPVKDLFETKMKKLMNWLAIIEANCTKNVLYWIINYEMSHFVSCSVLFMFCAPGGRNKISGA